MFEILIEEKNSHDELNSRNNYSSWM